MPSQQGLPSNDRHYFLELSVLDLLGFSRQPAPLLVHKPHSFVFVLLTQQPNLLSQTRDNLLGIFIEPASNAYHHKKNGIHEFRDYSIGPNSSPRRVNLLDVQASHLQRIAQSNELLAPYGTVSHIRYGKTGFPGRDAA